jgi:membrane protein
MIEDRIFGRAAELGFYFLFALFPTLFSASSLLGLAAKSGPAIYDKLLNYLGLVIPTSALSTVLVTFNQTTAAATTGKVTLGLIVSIWSASVGISAIQDTLNSVYRVKETRSFFRARIGAIGLTILLTATNTLTLAAMLGGDFLARVAIQSLTNPFLIDLAGVLSRLTGWAIATALLILSFAVTYYYAPDAGARRWHWLSPGAAFGILGWIIASLGLRLYLHFFNSYAVTYGSLGAVIILLTWFYITGLMLLTGAEIDSALELASAGALNSIHRPKA